MMKSGAAGLSQSGGMMVSEKVCMVLDEIIPIIIETAI